VTNFNESVHFFSGSDAAHRPMLVAYLKGVNSKPRMKTTWEYTTLKLSTEFSFFSGTNFDTTQLAEQLNAHGTDGWELVSIFDIGKVQGGSKFVVAVMKRPKV
jgi:Domain of unknown function (DUF4177)